MPEPGDNRMMERRREGRTNSPMETLQQLPALVVLERLPVPVLAVAEDGTILFANSAFGLMLGHPVEDVLAMKFQDIFCSAPDGSIVSVVREHADQPAELRHSDADGRRHRKAACAATTRWRWQPSRISPSNCGWLKSSFRQPVSGHSTVRSGF